MLVCLKNFALRIEILKMYWHWYYFVKKERERERRKTKFYKCLFTSDFKIMPSQLKSSWANELYVSRRLPLMICKMQCVQNFKYNIKYESKVTSDDSYLTILQYSEIMYR